MFWWCSRAVGSAWAFAAVLSLAPAVRAQHGPATSDADISDARDAGREGLEALQEGDYASAEELLSRAIELHDAPTLRLERARARVTLGRMLDGAEDYRVALRWPRAAGEKPAFARARRDAGVELAALQPRIPRLTLVLQGGGQARVRDEPWPRAAIGRPRKLDPGNYAVEAVSDDGSVHQRVQIRLEPGASKVASLDLRPQPKVAATPRPEPASVPPPQLPTALEAAAAAQVEPAPIEVPAPAGRAPSSSVPPEPDHTATYVVGGLSAAMLIASLVTGAITLSRRAKYDRLNASEAPVVYKAAVRHDGITMRTVSSVLTAGALAGCGVTAFLLWSVDRPSTERSGASAPTTTLGIALQTHGRF